MLNFVKWLRSGLLLALTLSWLCLHTGCGTARPVTGTPEGAPNKSNMVVSPDIISTGDHIAINFSDIPNPFNHEVRVLQDGKISLPLIKEKVVAAGKTAGKLQEDIHSLYVPKLYRRLTVTVKIDSRFYAVSGQVRAPGLLPYAGDMTVLRAIAAASDFTDFADKRNVVLTRANGEQFTVDCIRAQRDTNLDIPVYPGDQIMVPRRLF